MHDKTMNTTELRQAIVDSFSRTVNAVNDLGWDSNGGSPIDGSLESNMRNGTVIEVPEGEYLVTESHAHSDLKNWGLVATGDVRFVAPEGEVLRVFNLRDDCDNILIEGITFDQRSEYRGSMGNVVQVENGRALLKDLEYAGWEPSESNGSTSDLNVWPLNSEGLIVVDGFVRKGRTELVSYPANSLCLFSGYPSEGTLYIRNSHFENCGEHGVYASRLLGDVRIENSYFKNNQNTHARISGAGSYVKDSVFVWDVDNHPNEGSFQAQTGMTFEAGHTGQAGGLAEGCRFVSKSSVDSSGMLKVDGSHGGITVRDCHFITFEGSDNPPLNFEAPGSSHMLDGDPSRPWDITMDNVHATHRGGSRHSHDYVVRLQRRAGSTFNDVCFDASESSDIVALRVQNGDLEVTGQSTINGGVRTSSASVNGDWADLGSCTIPDESTPVGSEPEPEPLPHEIVVRAPEGSDPVTYRFTVDGEVDMVLVGQYAAVPRPPGGRGEEITENEDGTYTVEGIVARGGGDTFRFDGSVTSFSAEGTLNVYVDGELASFEESKPRSMFVDFSDVSGTAEFAVLINGEATEDYPSAAVYQGTDLALCVGYTHFWNHTFEITGTVEKVYAPRNTRITVDGESITKNDVEWTT